MVNRSLFIPCFIRNGIKIKHKANESFVVQSERHNEHIYIFNY